MRRRKILSRGLRLILDVDGDWVIFGWTWTTWGIGLKDWTGLSSLLLLQLLGRRTPVEFFLQRNLGDRLEVEGHL